MNKVKLALSLITIAIMIGPLLGMVYTYRDNLVGLVLPPTDQSMMGLTDSNLGSMNLTSLSNFQIVNPIGNPTYDQNTGAFAYPLNFTNPLPQTISIDHFSADIVGQQNGTTLGTVTLPDQVQIGPGDSAVLNVSGNINQQVLAAYENEYSTGNNVDIALANLNVTVGGISLYVDRVSNIGSLQLPG